MRTLETIILKTLLLKPLYVEEVELEVKHQENIKKIYQAVSEGLAMAFKEIVTRRNYFLTCSGVKGYYTLKIDIVKRGIKRRICIRHYREHEDEKMMNLVRRLLLEDGRITLLIVVKPYITSGNRESRLGQDYYILQINMVNFIGEKVRLKTKLWLVKGTLHVNSEVVFKKIMETIKINVKRSLYSIW